MDAIETQSGNSPSSLDARASSRRSVLVGLGLLLLVRVIYVVICPLELVPDEAYYWDWSRQLDWSYYSKPPMIAWLIWLATALGGNNEFAIRLPAAILGTLGLWAIYELGRRMYDERTGLWAMLAAAATPGLTAMSLLMTIDAPFLCAWTCAVGCLWNLVDSERPQWQWVLAAVVTTGLGLLSKQTMLGLYPLLFLFLISSRIDRPKLRSASLWFWIVGSLVFLMPVVWWNWHHEWVTVQHTREHFHAKSASLTRHAVWFFEFWGSQFGILSPLICLLLIVISWHLVPRLLVLARRERFLVCFGGIPLVAVTILSMSQKVQPNWPAALYLSGFILLAAWGTGALRLTPRLDQFRMLFRPAVVCGAVFSLVVALVPMIVPSSPWAGSSVDPTARLRGWKELAGETDRVLKSFPNSSDTLLVAATARGPVSALAFYMPNAPRVYRWNAGEVIDSQHDVWGGPSDGCGRDALIVTQEQSQVPQRLAQAFNSVEDRGRIVIRLGPNRLREFRVWRGVSLREWPLRRGVSHAMALRNTSTPG